jgi:hypothetical protein
MGHVVLPNGPTVRPRHDPQPVKRFLPGLVAQRAYSASPALNVFFSNLVFLFENSFNITKFELNNMIFL